ncbi:MAG TPA: hypothetical protein VJN96_00995 [Vicinamibacterales bacterium]|nr:hypothetical protein [Vicinamibacterales bacterium]
MAGIAERGPQIFAGVGVLMLLLAAYIAGGDTLACARHGATVDCDVTRTRLFGHIVVERATASDIVEVYVRRSYSEGGTTEPPDSPYAGKTTTNDNLAVKTRAGRLLDLMGGEPSGQLARAISALIKHESEAPISYDYSFGIIAGAVAVFGAIFLLFGAIGMRRA